MQLHELKPTHKNKTKKRVGRGGKRGTYSGRGQKGQRSRAGRKLPQSQLDVIKSIPKLRGIKNKSHAIKPVVINIEKLEALGEKVITKDVLRKKSIIKKRESAKILGTGELKTAITVEGIAMSKTAKEKIEKAGGTVR